MKVIDLLNRIANGEEVPKEIWCGGNRYKYNPLSQDYDSTITDNKDLLFHIGITRHLNDKITIIEEDKEIELIPIKDFNISYKLDFIDYKNIEVLKNHLNKDFQRIFDTLDLLIANQKILEKAVNELKKGK